MTETKNMDDLFKPKITREFTLNIDAETHRIVSEVAAETKKSRPRVLSVFIKEAYQMYLERKKAAEQTLAEKGDKKPKLGFLLKKG